jgi:DNA-binding HxlR family transcriptional regulator
MDLADLPGRPCPAAAALELVGDRWSLLVIREVSLGAHRFTRIQEGTGAPRDRLAARLKTLVDGGVLRRERYCEAPERYEYHLTDAGQELVPVIRALRAWGERWACTPGHSATPTPGTH